jgi:hypothetical protein
VESRHILKAVDTERRVFGGWAYQWRNGDGELITDDSGDFIDTPETEEALVDAWTSYTLESRSGDDQHETFGASTLVESMSFTDETVEALGIPDYQARGIFVKYRADDSPQGDELWEGVKTGERAMLSIVGIGVREDA